MLGAWVLIILVVWVHILMPFLISCALVHSPGLGVPSSYLVSCLLIWISCLVVSPKVNIYASSLLQSWSSNLVINWFSWERNPLPLNAGVWSNLGVKDEVVDDPRPGRMAGQIVIVFWSHGLQLKHTSKWSVNSGLQNVLKWNHTNGRVLCWMGALSCSITSQCWRVKRNTFEVKIDKWT